MAAAVTMAILAYSSLAVLAVAVLPEGCADWTEYIGNLGAYEGIEGLPTFYSAATPRKNSWEAPASLFWDLPPSGASSPV